MKQQKKNTSKKTLTIITTGNSGGKTKQKKQKIRNKQNYKTKHAQTYNKLTKTLKHTQKTKTQTHKIK